MRNVYCIFVVASLLYIPHVFAYAENLPWPLTPPGSSAANNLQAVWGDWGIGGTKGETPYGKLHDGIDLVGGDFPNVYCIKPGAITTIDRSDNGNAYISVNSGDGEEMYFHVMADKDLKIDDLVNTGKLLGQVQGKDHIHLHVFRHAFGGEVNPLSVLGTPLPAYNSLSVDDISIVVDDSHHYARDYSWGQHKVISQNGTPLIREKVDVVAKASSNMGGSTCVGLYKLWYQIRGDETATQSTTFSRLVFQFDGYVGSFDPWGASQTVGGNWANLMFGGDTAYSGNHYYIATNTSGDWTGNFSNIAEDNWNSVQFPDGKYKVLVKGWDYRVATNPNQAPATKEISVLVDNHGLTVSNPSLQQ